MTCANCSTSIENHLRTLDGLNSVVVSLVTHKATVKHISAKIGPRKIISEIEDIGFDAELQPSDQKVDIREIVKEEMIKFKKRMLMGTVLYLPILFFVWILPYIPNANKFVIRPIVWNGCPLYIFILLIIASVF